MTLKKKKYLKYILINIVIAAIIVTILMKFIFSAIKITGNSMSPTLNDNERIIISKLNIKKNIKRFDIIVLSNPLKANKSLVKRVIALPRETIELKNGHIYINDEQLKQPFLKNGRTIFTKLINFDPLVIKKGHYFVMGDNRNFSKDSRTFGAVPVNLIYGKAVIRYWPLSKFGSIK